jgi:hypothetical protein
MELLTSMIIPTAAQSRSTSGSRHSQALARKFSRPPPYRRLARFHTPVMKVAHVMP